LDDEKEGEWLPLNAPESKQRPADIQAVMNFLRR